MKKVSAKEHYDLLVQEGNDPVHDPPRLAAYMSGWDGEPFLDALGLSQQSRVLEIGVGTGRLARQVLQRGCGPFTGIDLSPAAIERAGENLRGWDNVSLILGDFLTWAPGGRFDVAYCSLTLFHIRDKGLFVQKVESLLPKGRFVLSIPKEKADSIPCGTRQVELYPDDVDHLEALLQEAGLPVCSRIEVPFAHILVAER